METRKTCSKCRELKTVSEFHRHNLNRDGLQPACKVCQNKAASAWASRNRKKANAITKAWVAANPDRAKQTRRRSRVKKKYGLTLEEYEALMTNAKCAICEDKVPKPQLDHCHSSGEVRGVLCSGCNLGLGHFRDRPELLRKAAKYLEK